MLVDFHNNHDIVVVNTDYVVSIFANKSNRNKTDIVTINGDVYTIDNSIRFVMEKLNSCVLQQDSQMIDTLI